MSGTPYIRRFNSFRLESEGPIEVGEKKVAYGDFNQDGIPDKVYVSSMIIPTCDLSILYGAKPKVRDEFTPGVEFQSYELAYSFGLEENGCKDLNIVQVVDADSDGDMDIIVSVMERGILNFYLIQNNISTAEEHGRIFPK